MKSSFLILPFILLLSACNSSESDFQDNEKSVAFSDTAISMSFKESNFFSILDSVYNLETIDFQHSNQVTKDRYYEHTDSVNVINFTSYLTFNLVEYNSASAAQKEFSLIRTKAQHLKARRKAPSEIHRLFYKGGVTYILADNYIISHKMRCSSSNTDYKKDKILVNQIEESGSNTDWIRSQCGWNVIEMKN